LLDHCAKAIERTVRSDDSLFGYRLGSETGDLEQDDRDSARFMPKAS
jgi:hypothetical protein